MKRVVYNFKNRKFKIMDAHTSMSEIIFEIIVNFFFGFVGNSIGVFIAKEKDLFLIFNFMIYYMFVSFVVNRVKYDTNFGKFIVMPIPATLGAYIGYLFASYLSKLI